jgi:hypothetical protein
LRWAASCRKDEIGRGYGPSPENQIAYVDALFMCTSAMAVTGLNSVLLASVRSVKDARKDQRRERKDEEVDAVKVEVGGFV